jgi:hypothetical protein
VGLIDDDAVVACNGVIACDHAINAATANPIPIVPVENNSLRITASFVFVECCYDEALAFRTLPLPLESGVVQHSFVSWETRNVGAGFVRSCA